MIYVEKSKSLIVKNIGQKLAKLFQENNYRIADSIDREISINEVENCFSLQDKSLDTKEFTGCMLCFREFKVYQVGYINIYENKILIKVFGEAYISKFKKIINNFDKENNIDMVLSLEEEKSIYHFPHRSLEIC